MRSACLRSSSATRMRASTTEVSHGGCQEVVKNSDLTADSQVPDRRSRIVAAMRRKTLLPAAVAGLAIVTAACSPGGTNRSSSAGASTAASTSNERDERLTPLSAFFTDGRDGEPTQAERDAAAEDFRRQEEIIADCMHEQGFEYV